MLRKKSKFLIFFLVLVFLFSGSFVCADNEADVNLTTETNTIENQVSNEISQEEQKNETFKKSDLYLCDDNVTIDYIVDGNIFIIANKVTINSQIGGDAFIIAKDIVIDSEGYIFNNLFASAQSIDIKGIVYDLYSCAQTVNLSGGYVYRDIKTVCETLNINGTVGRNVFVSTANINFNNSTDNENSSDQTTGNKGVIYGNLEYSSSKEANIPDNTVLGDVKFSKQTSINEKMSVSTIVANYILDLGAFLAFVLIIWLVCLWLAPKFLDSTNKYVGTVSWKVLGIGLLTLIVIPIICFILILLQLTSSISLLLLALYILALIVSTSLFTITANKYICTKLNIHKNSGVFGMLIVSGIIIWVLKQLPYIGSVISFIITILGLGILTMSLLPKNTKKEETEKKSTENK